MSEKEMLVCERGGVRWYSSPDGKNTRNRMKFEGGRCLHGSWCQPAAVFHALAALPPDERIGYYDADPRTCDVLKGLIGAQIRGEPFRG